MMDVKIDWSGIHGDFLLSDGSYGNPGCDDCGSCNAVVRINDYYYCRSGLEQVLDAAFQPPSRRAR